MAYEQLGFKNWLQERGLLSNGSTGYHLTDFLGQNFSSYVDPTII